MGNDIYIMRQIHHFVLIEYAVGIKYHITLMKIFCVVPTIFQFNQVASCCTQVRKSRYVVYLFGLWK